MIIFKNCSDGAEINSFLMNMGVLKLMVESEGDLSRSFLKTTRIKLRLILY